MKIFNGKHLLWIIAATVFLSCFSACTNNDKDNYQWLIGEENKMVFNDKYISITIDNDILSSTGATFTIDNFNSEDASCGLQYWLQIKIDDKWHDIEIKEQDWTLESISIPSGEKKTITVDWNGIYGELPTGKYQFIKKFLITSEETNIYVNCEFEL